MAAALRNQVWWNVVPSIYWNTGGLGWNLRGSKRIQLQPLPDEVAVDNKEQVETDMKQATLKTSGDPTTEVVENAFLEVGDSSCCGSSSPTSKDTDAPTTSSSTRESEKEKATSSSTSSSIASSSRLAAESPPQVSSATTTPSEEPKLEAPATPKESKVESPATSEEPTSGVDEDLDPPPTPSPEEPSSEEPKPEAGATFAKRKSEPSEARDGSFDSVAAQRAAPSATNLEDPETVKKAAETFTVKENTEKEKRRDGVNAAREQEKEDKRVEKELRKKMPEDFPQCEELRVAIETKARGGFHSVSRGLENMAKKLSSAEASISILAAQMMDGRDLAGIRESTKTKILDLRKQAEKVHHRAAQFIITKRRTTWPAALREYQEWVQKTEAEKASKMVAGGSSEDDDEATKRRRDTVARVQKKIVDGLLDRAVEAVETVASLVGELESSSREMQNLAIRHFDDLLTQAERDTLSKEIGVEQVVDNHQDEEVRPVVDEAKAEPTTEADAAAVQAT
ncbi:unnamed protein product [Amoebophrya sp. A25]|nr:unnamed protein product [Amoebophrya sp. A25]|eukprot:GSA25T00017712001.1